MDGSVPGQLRPQSCQEQQLVDQESWGPRTEDAPRRLTVPPPRALLTEPSYPGNN